MLEKMWRVAAKRANKNIRFDQALARLNGLEAVAFDDRAHDAGVVDELDAGLLRQFRQLRGEHEAVARLIARQPQATDDLVPRGERPGSTATQALRSRIS